MILVCPNCVTRYRVPDGSIGDEGRQVRCRNCGHRWQAVVAAAEGPSMPEAAAPPAVPMATQPAVEPAAIPASPADAEAPLPPVRPEPMAAGRGERIAGGIAWALFFLLAVACAGLFIGREQLLARVPWAAPLYQAFGLGRDASRGFQLRNAGSARRAENGRDMLVVHGEIANLSGEERAVPGVRVALIDDQGGEVAFGLFEAASPSLAPNAVTSFDAEWTDPPPAAKSYRVSLVERP